MSEDLENRVKLLEGIVKEHAVTLGKNDVDKDYIKQRFDKLETEFKELSKTLKNINYLIYAALIGAIVKFIVDGGLTNV